MTPNEFRNELTFTTQGEPKRDHYFEQFVLLLCYSVCFHCYEMCLVTCYPETEVLPLLTVQLRGCVY
jgi:hypothetical protein